MKQKSKSLSYTYDINGKRPSNHHWSLKISLQLHNQNSNCIKYIYTTKLDREYVQEKSQQTCNQWSITVRHCQSVTSKTTANRVLTR